MWDAGGDPYSRDVWRIERTIGGVDPSRDELLPYVGPAAALPLFGALARLPFPVAVRVWSGLLAAAFGALVLCSLALSGARRIGVLLGAFILAIISGPMTSDLALGQAALVTAAGIAVAMMAFERGSIALGTVGTLLAGMQPNLALGLIARMRDRVAIASAAIAGTAFAALTLAAGGGVPGFLAYLHRLAKHGSAERFVSIQHTPAAVAWSLGTSPAVAATFGNVCAVVAIVLVVIATVRARLNPRDGTLLALAALPLAIPFFHEHDFVVTLIPLLVLAVSARGAARASAGIAAGLVLVDWFGLAQRQPAQAQIVAQGIAIACAFAAIGPGRRLDRVDLAAPLTVIAAAAFALPLALFHPAPTWPDGLPPRYHAPANADASAVWSEEQRYAGLDARQAAWGALRALPLAGCVVLGISVVLYGRRRSA